MCVSHGLDPRWHSREQILEREAEWFAEWAGAAAEHTGTMWPSWPTSKRTYPIVTADGVTPGWWGHLVDGKPATYWLHGANSRSERFEKSAPKRRALVPVSFFLEQLDADKSKWYRYQGADAGSLLLLAATVQDGALADGTVYDCYSIITQDPPAQLVPIHKRTVMLVPPALAGEWLHSTSKTVVPDIRGAAAALQESIEPIALAGKPA